MTLKLRIVLLEIPFVMWRSLLLIISLAVIAIGFACGGQNSRGADSPTESYKRLYAAVKSKDTEAIKKQLTKKTLDFGVMSSQRYNKTLDAAYENGFTDTTFSESLPTIRDERIKDNMGSIEVWNSKNSVWEDLPFINEDGGWKLAQGDLFAGSFKSPGKGRDQREKEAANAVGANTVQPLTNTNGNRPLVVKTPAGMPAINKAK